MNLAEILQNGSLREIALFDPDSDKDDVQPNSCKFYECFKFLIALLLIFFFVNKIGVFYYLLVVFSFLIVLTVGILFIVFYLYELLFFIVPLR